MPINCAKPIPPANQSEIVAMIAVDTNVLARLLLRDDEAQYRKVVKLFGDGRDYTAPVTVMLELVWVLESYGNPPIFNHTQK